MARYITTFDDALRDQRVRFSREFLAARKAAAEEAHRAAYKAELRRRAEARKNAARESFKTP